MQHGWRGQHFISLPLLISLAGCDPFATFKLSIAGHSRLLFDGTRGQEKPGVESPRSKRRRNPTSDKSEIARVEMQTKVLQQLWPRHPRGLEIVEQRRPLAD